MAESEAPVGSGFRHDQAVSARATPARPARMTVAQVAEFLKRHITNATLRM
jgi:hypothetical protein